MTFEIEDVLFLLLVLLFEVLSKLFTRKTGAQSSTFTQNSHELTPKDGRVLDILHRSKNVENVTDEAQTAFVGTDYLEFGDIKNNYIPELVASLLAIRQKRISNKTLPLYIRDFLRKECTKINNILLKDEQR